MDRRDQNQGTVWAAFYLEHRRPLATYALALAANHPDAEDLMQETLWRMVKDDRPIKRAWPYVLQSMRNLTIDRHRDAAARPETSKLEPDQNTFIDPDLGDLAQQEPTSLFKAASQPKNPQAEMISSPTLTCPVGQEATIVVGQEVPAGTTQRKDGAIYKKEGSGHADMGLEIGFTVDIANEKAVSFHNFRIRLESFSTRHPIAPVPFEGSLDVRSTEEHTFSMILPANKMAVIRLTGSPPSPPMFAVITAQLSK